MNAGRHSADGGSFGRSAGGAAARGTALIVVAVLIGFFLLRATDDRTPIAASGGDQPAATTTTVAEDTPTTLALRPPSEVKVLVANGSDVSGAAKKTSDTLRAAGYNVLAATDTNAPATAPAVYFTPGFEAEAAAIASALGVGQQVVAAMPSPPPVDDVRGANVLVVLDRGMATASPTPAQPAATTTTTA